MRKGSDTPKAGIYFTCSTCETTLYRVSAADKKGLSRIYKSITRTLKSCGGCGREITFDVNPDLVRVYAANRL
ncbi:MAG: hypothetical protein ACLPY5_06350 [Candidatus Bathyarchaeia archaeon]